MRPLTALQYGPRASLGMRAGLISLREILMTLGTYAHAFGEAMRWLSKNTSLMRHVSDYWSTDSMRESVILHVDSLRRSCETLGMAAVLKHIERVMRVIENVTKAEQADKLATGKLAEQ